MDQSVLLWWLEVDGSTSEVRRCPTEVVSSRCPCNPDVIFLKFEMALTFVIIAGAKLVPPAPNRVSDQGKNNHFKRPLPVAKVS